jgi:flagellum-specific ATP synthase
MTSSAERGVHTAAWVAGLKRHVERLGTPPCLRVEGKVVRMVGLTLEAVGVRAAIGERCSVSISPARSIEAEVVGFGGDRLYLMPTGRPEGLQPGARVVPLGRGVDVPAGPELLGRVLDGAGRPIDDGGPLRPSARAPLHGRSVNPLTREPIAEPLDVGVRAINALLTVGKGQRVGLFAPAGVGKSVLLGMIARYTSADVIVVGLIGERGREVKEFIEQNLGAEARERAVVIASPADLPPLMRVHGAATATAIAEHFRDQGMDVLLLMDSLTRYCQAQREIALTIGEPPATRGFPPSVFARLPQLVERAGPGSSGCGSITAIYTVLCEGEDADDPIAEAARAILDGHIVLSRRLAESGHFPAIDIESSISRVMHQVIDEHHQQAARQFRQSFHLVESNRDLVNVGAYRAGTNAELDRALNRHPLLQAFLRQRMDESVGMETSREQLHACLQI